MGSRVSTLTLMRLRQALPIALTKQDTEELLFMLVHDTSRSARSQQLR